MTNHKNIRKNLLDLIEMFPAVLQNRNELLRYYWSIYDDVKTISDVSKATSAESIMRNLRRLGQEGIVILPNRVKEEKVEEYRHEFAPLV